MLHQRWISCRSSRKSRQNLARCRFAPPPLIAAALSVFPEIEAAQAIRLLRRLSKALGDGEPFKEDFSDYRRADSPSSVSRRSNHAFAACFRSKLWVYR